MCYKNLCVTGYRLQEDEEVMEQAVGAQRRLWDDDYVIKRQFSALIPAFDPRPGRSNVNQTQDFEIPPPGAVATQQPSTSAAAAVANTTANTRDSSSDQPQLILRLKGSPAMAGVNCFFAMAACVGCTVI